MCNVTFLVPELKDGNHFAGSALPGCAFPTSLAAQEPGKVPCCWTGGNAALHFLHFLHFHLPAPHAQGTGPSSGVSVPLLFHPRAYRNNHTLHKAHSTAGTFRECQLLSTCSLTSVMHRNLSLIEIYIRGRLKLNIFLKLPPQRTWRENCISLCCLTCYVMKTTKEMVYFKDNGKIQQRDWDRDRTVLRAKLSFHLGFSGVVRMGV